jgi:5-(aminomethyl)-3-furanmethanol phosphate kinase
VTPHAVVKLGGSLFCWEHLPERLAAYLDSRRGQCLVLIAGGGPAADLVREIDSRHALGDERAHALALRALDLTAHLAAALAEGLVVVEHPRDFPAAWSQGKTPVLAPRAFLDADDRDPLPCSWHVTSDSIAARIAERLGAGELVLLKSAPLPQGTDRAQAAQLGLVDPAFPALSRCLPRVIYVNLREPNAPAAPL